ncbi:MAG TPA: response regulator transcription factor [Sphingobacteriaceae bacterium]
MQKKVLVADDHGAIRNGLKNILQQQYPDLKFGECKNAQQTIKKLHDERWDLLILDIEMPGRNGFDVLKQIQSDHLKTPVLVFSFHSEDQVAVRAFRAGAAGYLAKDAEDLEIVSAVDQILAGKKYITNSVAQSLASQIGFPTDKEPHELLSDREYQILRLISSGKTVSEISHELSLSTSTISTYRARILEKMSMKTNAELTNYTIKKNLL